VRVFRYFGKLRIDQSLGSSEGQRYEEAVVVVVRQSPLAVALRFECHIRHRCPDCRTVNENRTSTKDPKPKNKKDGHANTTPTTTWTTARNLSRLECLPSRRAERRRITRHAARSRGGALGSRARLSKYGHTLCNAPPGF
jgi:phage FluMu protein Com